MLIDLFDFNLQLKLYCLRIVHLYFHCLILYLLKTFQIVRLWVYDYVACFRQKNNP